MKTIPALTLTAIFTSLLFPSSLHAQPETPIDAEALKKDLETVRDSFRVPGMAVVALQDGGVVFKEGFGYRNVDKGQPFTPDTIGLVASTTKSITAGLVGTLVDDGTLEWTRPVREYWPVFKMVDPFASKEMTLEDMLSHRSGLPYHENLLAYGVGRELPDKAKAQEYRLKLLKRLAHFEPSYSFRAGWKYQDVVYASAGGIVEQVTGKHYEDLVQARILDPLGMKNSTFSRKEARESGMLAQGYGVVDGTVVAIPFADTRYLAPTAGLYSSAEEMAKWVQLNIDRGTSGERQIISGESMDWIHGAHAIVSNDAQFLGGGLATYGQGWSQHTFRGLATVGHSGSFNGYRTHIAFIPEKRIGVVVLTNLNLSQAMVAASFVTMDRLLENESAAEWIGHFQSLEKASAEAEEAAHRAFESGRDPSRKPGNELMAYAGTYHHPGYGAFEIALRDGVLEQTYDGRTFKLKPYNGETFETRYQSTENHLHHMTMTFETDGEGKVVAMRLPIVPGIDPPRFVRE